ncbi:MAG: hypothetical protein GXO66_10430 [Euryarchaeota archaeon]|nr:hypothetical protein [Euryarchaeota archaeon]
MELTKSVFILAPPEVVFRTVSNVPLRLSLNPFWRVLEVRKLTPGGLAPGTRFWVRLRSDAGEVAYTSECLELEENRRLRSRAVEAGFEVLLSLREVAGGTVLTHTEILRNGEERLRSAAEDVLEAWLENLKSYSELANSRFRFLLPLVRRCWLARKPGERELIKLMLIIELGLGLGALAAIAVARLLF